MHNKINDRVTEGEVEGMSRKMNTEINMGNVSFCVKKYTGQTHLQDALSSLPTGPKGG